MDQDSNDELAALFASYANELPGLIQEIVEIWHILEKKWDDGLLTELHRKIHNLAGSAGMYGYEKVSQTAHQIQLVIRSSAQQNKLTPDEQHRISALVVELGSYLSGSP